MKIFGRIMVAVIAVSLFGMMLIFWAAYVKYQQKEIYLEDEKRLGDHYLYEEYSNGEKRVKDLNTEQVVLEDLQWIVSSEAGDDLAVFCQQGKRGYWNCSTGRVEIPARYERAWLFSEGLAAVMVGGKIGFINREGEMVLEPTWVYPLGEKQMDYLFKGGYCAVYDTSEWCGLIDTAGNWALDPDYDYIYPLEQGVRFLQCGEMWGALTDSLQVLLPVEYDWLKLVDGGILCIKGGDQCVVGRDGKTVVQAFVYDDVHPLYYSSGEFGEEGEELVVKCKYFEYGIWNPKGERFGLMNEKGERVTEALYSEIQALSDHLFLCTMEDGLYKVLVRL